MSDPRLRIQPRDLHYCIEALAHLESLERISGNQTRWQGAYGTRYRLETMLEDLEKLNEPSTSTTDG